MAYNEKLSAKDQIDMEVKIASLIFITGMVTEEAASLLGKTILQGVLRKFRPDLWGNNARG